MDMGGFGGSIRGKSVSSTRFAILLLRLSLSCYCAIPAASSGHWCMPCVRHWWTERGAAAWEGRVGGFGGSRSMPPLPPTSHLNQPLPGETSAACCVAITTSLTHRDVRLAFTRFPIFQVFDDTSRAQQFRISNVSDTLPGQN